VRRESPIADQLEGVARGRVLPPEVLLNLVESTPQFFIFVHESASLPGSRRGWLFRDLMGRPMGRAPAAQSMKKIAEDIHR
jgi:hypothetical protein